MFYFILFVILVVSSLWLYKDIRINTIYQKSNALMQHHGLFIRQFGGVNPKYYICKNEEGKDHYLLTIDFHSDTYGTFHKNTKMCFTTNERSLHKCYVSDSEVRIREQLVILWSGVVDTDTFTDIKPPSKNTPKVDNLISQLVKAEMDGDKEKVELIFNQYLND